GEKQHLQVYLRIRPFTSEESKRGESQDCVTIEALDTVLLRPPSSPAVSARFSTDRALPQAGQRFRFSKVYGPETTQRELFDGTVKDLVKDALEGTSTLVFTYGVTNAGKTFTFLGPDADAGILPRSLDVIFNSMEGQVFCGMSIKPHRCREFTRLSREQQAEEELFKRNLFRQTVEVMSSISSTSEDGVKLKVEANTKFSVWVSFCEIYNENIHDLLEVTPSGAPRRTALRLSQDIKGNAFIKDLRWVQVDTAEEAYKVVKLGKKNQSFCSTRLNNLSSRSHSIFSIRILRIEDAEMPRVSTVSELCLCDLAGSERCAKTQNKGERLKEAGNINTSLLILGKCINALRHKQQTKLLQHVPFRESKLTHYLQGFFCGRGKTCMIVNINQCASMYDETLSVLKFSAVAQKVYKQFLSLFLTEHPFFFFPPLFTLCCLVPQRMTAELKQLQVQLKKERAESMLLEARIREETSQEFSQLFHEMQNDFTQERETSSKQLNDLTEKLSQKDQALDLLEANLKQKVSNLKTEEDLRRLNSDLQSEVAFLKVKLSNIEAKESSVDVEQMLKEKDEQMEEKLAELKKASEDREAELLKKVLEAEAEVASLQKGLQAAQEKREDEECQAVREARRKEVERRKELLAVAHEAIAQKDAELKKRAEEISRLKEIAQQDSEKMKNLSLDLQRKEEDSSDLQDKLTDYKKQMQQVQKEIAAMREEEKLLRQKLADIEKSKKQLQCELSTRDRTIQQLRLVLLVFGSQKHMFLVILINFFPQLHSFCVQMMTEKQQTERKKWLEEKLSLIGQAKEAEDKRNREMRKFAEDRERYTRQQGQLESQLLEKEKTMENWRKERDTLVAALEVQLQKLLSSQAEKDRLIQQLRQQNTQPPQEVSGVESSSNTANLQAFVTEKEAEVLQLRRELEEIRATQVCVEKVTLCGLNQSKMLSDNIFTQWFGSTGFPSVLDSSEISTENGRSSRFPRPELEISFSPLQPNRMALRRQGEESAVTVKITRTARKRKSGEMEKVRAVDETATSPQVEAENRRNTRSKLTPKLTPQKEESSSPAGCHDSQSSVRSRKEGALQKIGDFLQSSPTLLGSKAKKMMSLVSGRTDADSAASSSSLALRAKKNRKKLYRPEISSPMEMPSHPVSFTHILFKRRFSVLLTKLFFIPLDKLQMCKCFCLDSWI
uniref:Kinesin family member 20Ba n=1 Tax=Oryzias latipes TaxID=8090 RepID=A0A3P9IH43_ORYLA